MLRSLMVSCSVAQAKLFVKAGVYVMPARHDQEGAPQVGSNGRNSGPEAIELPRAQRCPTQTDSSINSSHSTQPAASALCEVWPTKSALLIKPLQPLKYVV